ncbi:MAG: DUF4349 domain-containing protein [Firmicutes bacterium]|nr:DUF4349 domain-containing protein [Bacillota bacterium]
MKKSYTRLICLVTALLVVAALFTSCSSSFNGDSASPKEDYYDGNRVFSENVAPEYSYDLDYEAKAPAQNENRKLVRTCQLSIETKDFDSALNDIESSAEVLGGYIESSGVTGKSVYSGVVQRTASYTVRIPADSLDEYVSGIEAKYNMLKKTTGSVDISDEYYDTEARLNSLEIQEKRLLEMLEKADELNYMLELNSALSDVRYQIEKMTSQMKRYDNSVTYATVSISLSEVVEYTEINQAPKNFGERFSSAAAASWKNFVSGCENFAIGFIYALPGIIIFAVIAACIVFIIAGAVKRSRRKAALRTEQFRKNINADASNGDAENK